MPSSGHAASEDRERLGLRTWSLRLILVSLAVAALYLPTLSHDFVGWDDPVYLTQNADVRQPSLGTILSPTHLTASDWTPTVTLSYAAEYAVAGLNPRVYHATNLALHILSVALLAVMLRRLGFSDIEALLAALIFGLHPLNVESVAWISSRKNLLAAVFALGFVLQVLAARPLAATVLFGLALASKGTTVVLPLWAIACMYWYRPPLRRPALWIGLFIAMAFGRGLISVQSQAAVVERTAILGFGQRLVILGPVFATQLRQFFLPYDLALFYSWPPLSWEAPVVLMDWAVVVLTVAMVAIFARRRSAVALVAVFAAAALLPTSNLLPAPYLQADRYVHLALLGAAPLLVASLTPLRRRHRALPSTILIAWCALVAVPFSLQRIAVWTNGETLWRDTTKRLPDYPLAWANLGAYYRSVGAFDKGEEAYRRGIALEPGLHYDLALLFIAAEQPAKAEVELRALLASAPEHAAGRGALGELLQASGRDSEALPQLDNALRINPGMSFAHVARARALLHLGRLDEAEQEFQQVAALKGIPASVVSDFAALRLRQNRSAEATDLANRALAQAPELTDAWRQLARAQVAEGRPDQAETTLLQATRAAAEPADIYYELADLRSQRGNRSGARQAATEALAQIGTTKPEWLVDARRLASQ